MMINIKFPPVYIGPPVTELELVAFREFIHMDIPPAYEQFLRTFNGCVPSPHADTYNSTIDLPGGNEISIHEFYTLRCDNEELSSLFEELERYVECIPNETIPIGHDLFGNILGLDCNEGTVNWTLLEARFGPGEWGTYFLEVSFEDFWNGLVAGPYVE